MTDEPTVAHSERAPDTDGRRVLFVNTTDFLGLGVRDQTAMLAHWDAVFPGHIRLPDYIESIESGGKRRTTRQMVKDMRLIDHSMPAVRMSELLGVSRERVRQLLVSEGLPTRTSKWRLNGNRTPISAGCLR